MKVAIAVEALRAHVGKPEAGSTLDALLREMLVESRNDAANEVEATFGGGIRVDELLRGIGLVDTWMGGGYLRETQRRPPIPTRVESQPSFGCCEYTTAFDLARLLADVHLAAGGRGPLSSRYGSSFTSADDRYLLYLLARVPDRGKLGRFIGVVGERRRRGLGRARRERGQDDRAAPPRARVATVGACCPRC